MNVLVVDVGGTNVKVLATGQDEPRRFSSGPTLTAEQMVAGVKELTGEWPYDVVSLGYPGLVHEGRIVAEPRNLASGWGGFDFAAAFGYPVSLLSTPTTWCLAGATPKNCKRSLQGAAWATTPMRSWEGFACGEKRP
jgi:predicted NBD/HSP70 family sugar kinase